MFEPVDGDDANAGFRRIYLLANARFDRTLYNRHFMKREWSDAGTVGVEQKDHRVFRDVVPEQLADPKDYRVDPLTLVLASRLRSLRP